MLSSVLMKREIWIDILKGIAIFAVVLDHAFYLFPEYRNTVIWQHTYFSIPWFVFLSGAANTFSAVKKRWRFPGTYITFWRKRVGGIVIPYILASAVAFIFLNYPHIDTGKLIREILYFSTQPPFYFINLILQLYFLYPLIYSLTDQANKIWQRGMLVIFIFILSFKIFLVSGPPWPFSPTGAIFGGRLLFVFFLGMIIVKWKFWESKLMKIGAIITFIAYELFLIISNGNFLETINFHSVAWSVSLLWVAYWLVGFLARHLGFPRSRHPLFFCYRKTYKIIDLLAYLGRHSLFIYLFHFLILTLLAKVISGGGIGFIFAIVMTIFLSLLVEYAYNLVSRVVSIIIKI